MKLQPSWMQVHGHVPNGPSTLQLDWTTVTPIARNLDHNAFASVLIRQMGSCVIINRSWKYQNMVMLQKTLQHHRQEFHYKSIF